MAAEPTTATRPPGMPGGEELVYDVRPPGLNGVMGRSRIFWFVSLGASLAFLVLFLGLAFADRHVNGRPDVFPLLLCGVYMSWTLISCSELASCRSPMRLLVANEGIGLTDRIAERRVGRLSLHLAISVALAAYLIAILGMAWAHQVDYQPLALALAALMLAAQLLHWVWYRLTTRARPPRDGLPGLSPWSRIWHVCFSSRAENVYRLRIDRGFWLPRMDCELTLDPLAFQTLVQSIRKHSAAPILLDGRSISTRPAETQHGATA